MRKSASHYFEDGQLMFKRAKGDDDRQESPTWLSQVFLPLYKKANVAIQAVAEVAAWCCASYHEKEALRVAFCQYVCVKHDYDDFYEWLKDSVKPFLGPGKPDWDWIRERIHQANPSWSLVEAEPMAVQEWWEGYTIKGKMLMGFSLSHWEVEWGEREKMLITLNEAAKKLSSVSKLLRSSPQPSGSDMRKIKKEFEDAVEEYIDCFKCGIKFLKHPRIPPRFRLNPKLVRYHDWVGKADRAADKMEQCAEDVSASLEK